jgi:hypothetical protein
MRRIGRWAWLAVVGLGVGACGSDSSGPDDDGPFSGTYSLRTINGTALPYTVGEVEGFKLEIVSDVFTFNENRTFRDIAVTRETENGVPTTVTDTIDGTFVVLNNTIQLTETGGQQLTATLSGGNTMTASGQGLTFVYRK